MLKGKALRRALATTDAIRIGVDLPVITDTTEIITPDVAREMLRKNTMNRPINWKKVEEYAAVMRAGQWQLHGQGIILDTNGNILTGQKRLWAVVYSDTNVYMRISRGNPPKTASIIDRGVPQSARDLSARLTGRAHSPTEASIARAYCALMGNVRPNTDQLSEVIAATEDLAAAVLLETKGTKKTRTVLMVLGAIVKVAVNVGEAKDLAQRVADFSPLLDQALFPQTSKACWGKGSAFGLAMQQAERIVRGRV